MLTDSQRESLVLRLRQSRTADAGQIPRREFGLAELPLSYGQEQLWFVDRFAPGLPTYNIPHAIRLSGPLDRLALERAIGRLIARHEALRIRLIASDGMTGGGMTGGGMTGGGMTGERGRPVQVIDPPAPVTLGLEDLAGFEPIKQQAWLREFIYAEAMRPFDLAAGPLLRTSLVRQASGEHLLVAVFHHTVFDGWSAGVFVRDLAALYRAEVTAEPSGLAELPVQFADYAVWERQRLRGQTLAELESYWRRALDGFETIAFPADRPRPVVDDFTGALAERTTDAALLAELRELSRREGATLFAALMAGLLALLYRYTGQTDLVVGTVSANRSRAELTPLIGFLVNTLPIRCDTSGDPAFCDLLARVKDAIIGAFAHQDLPFGKLVDTVGVERDASRAPTFQIALTYAEPDNTPVPAAGVDFLVTDLVRGVDAAKVDLTFTTEARRDGLWIECCYKTALFEPGTIERLLTHLETLLRGVVANPEARLSELPLLTGAELRAELHEWNNTVLDPHLNPVPVGVLGELSIDGAKTGDLVRRRPDGTLMSVRRAKIGRTWVELGEVEAALMAHPDVAQAVVLQAEDKELGAYLRRRPGSDTIDADEVRAHLACTVPAVMIPAHLVMVEAIPLSPSGEVDRSALPTLVPPGQPTGGSLPPATLIEVMLADIYATVLGVSQVAATDNFFELGGNSLHAMRLVSALDTELDVDVGAATVFLAPTPRQLAALLRKEHGFADADLGTVGLG